MTEEFQDCVLAARSELARARQLLNAEISDYPTPISGCDAQFNTFWASVKKYWLRSHRWMTRCSYQRRARRPP